MKYLKLYHTTTEVNILFNKEVDNLYLKSTYSQKIESLNHYNRHTRKKTKNYSGQGQVGNVLVSDTLMTQMDQSPQTMTVSVIARSTVRNPALSVTWGKTQRAGAQHTEDRAGLQTRELE